MLIFLAHLFFLPHLGLKSLPGNEVELNPKKSEEYKLVYMIFT